MTPSPANKCVSIACSHFLRAFIVFHSLSIVPNSSRLRHLNKIYISYINLMPNIITILLFIMYEILDNKFLNFFFMFWSYQYFIIVANRLLFFFVFNSFLFVYAVTIVNEYLLFLFLLAKVYNFIDITKYFAKNISKLLGYFVL